MFWSVPTFWLALILLMVFGGTLRWFPTGGMVSLDAPSDPLGYMLDVISHMILPVITMTAVIYAQYLMVMRSSIIDEATADYATTARAKGLKEDQILNKHVVPNALLPTVTLVFMHIGGLIAGAVTVEAVFSWPGLGKLTFEAITGPDLPLLQGTFVVFSAIIIAMNFIADLVYRRLAPESEESMSTSVSERANASRNVAWERRRKAVAQSLARVRAAPRRAHGPHLPRRRHDRRAACSGHRADSHARCHAAARPAEVRSSVTRASPRHRPPGP